MNEHRRQRMFEAQVCQRKKHFGSYREAAAHRSHMDDPGLRIYKCPAHPNQYLLGRIHDAFGHRKTFH